MLFLITYTDPETGEEVTVQRECFDTPGEVTPNGMKIGPISALEWAEDIAYMLADKGPYRVVELKK